MCKTVLISNGFYFKSLFYTSYQESPNEGPRQIALCTIQQDQSSPLVALHCVLHTRSPGGLRSQCSKTLMPQPDFPVSASSVIPTSTATVQYEKGVGGQGYGDWENKNREDQCPFPTVFPSSHT